MVRAPHYIGIACSCTNNRLRDCVGILRISDDGTIFATCYCNDAFNRNASVVKNLPMWRTKVWVLNCIGEKIKLGERCFLRYYKGDEYVRPHNQVSQRDELLSCVTCYKVCRFELRTRDACSTYHDVATRENRTSSNTILPGELMLISHLELKFS
ncbi:putative developmental regulator, ULTRAPETALA [Helianthus annuus]|uniref:Developmental regulator, ULTRAPETALA n=1 Tax=Helianthus annuus TaxID=4232 RepID=A0A9K3J1K9_HELAN|nr:putative developmental regulator, ULTRAPETALA [Helianthus annuus]